MAALVTIIGGRYSATYMKPGGSALDLGVTNDPGYKLSFTPDWEIIKDTDAYASNVIEALWMGLSEVALDFVTKEIKQGPYDAISPFNTWAPTGAGTFQSGLVSRRATDLVGPVVMSATASTPAAATPATLTANYCMIHEGVDVSMIFGPRHRTIPIRFRLIAYTNSGVPAYFTVT